MNQFGRAVQRQSLLEGHFALQVFQVGGVVHYQLLRTDGSGNDDRVLRKVAVLQFFAVYREMG
jgi:hypothetical protein